MNNPPLPRELTPDPNLTRQHLEKMLSDAHSQLAQTRAIVNQLVAEVSVLEQMLADRDNEIVVLRERLDHESPDEGELEAAAEYGP